MSKKKRRKKRTFAQKMAEARKQCLDYERNREWYWRQSEQGEFESSFVSLDDMADQLGDASKVRFQHSQTLGGVISGISNMPLNLSDQHKLKMAYQKLRRAGKGYLVRTLQLIVRNGKNRKESIWQMMLDMCGQKSNITNTEHNWRQFSESPCGRKGRKHPKTHNSKKGVK